MRRGRSRSTFLAYGRLLEGIAGDLLRAVGPSDVAARVYHRLAPRLALDAYFNFLVDREAQDLVLVGHAGVPGQLIADVTRLPMGAGVCGHVARAGRAVIVSNVHRSRNARLIRLRQLGFDSYACFPLHGREGLVGTLSFGRKRQPAFSRLEIELLRSVSSPVALAALVPHLFEMFHQGPAAASGSQGGLGIGLALVRRLVDMHGGSIRAASEGRGRGAEFLVTLPRLAAVLSAPSTEIPSPVARGETQLSVLAIDDCQDSVFDIRHSTFPIRHSALDIPPRIPISARRPVLVPSGASSAASAG